MVAYSFQKQFSRHIRLLTKQQTIRAERKRHARPGEQLQLYTGMRTRFCSLIGRAVCSEVLPITIDIEGVRVESGGLVLHGHNEMDIFATADGFRDWSEMRGFWRKHHPGVTVFSGVVIRWVDFAPSENAQCDGRTETSQNG